MTSLNSEFTPANVSGCCVIEKSSKTKSEKITTKAQEAINRSEILDEIWAANKVTHNGHWYVKLSDVANILGEDYATKTNK